MRKSFCKILSQLNLNNCWQDKTHCKFSFCLSCANNWSCLELSHIDFKFYTFAKMCTLDLFYVAFKLSRGVFLPLSVIILGRIWYKTRQKDRHSISGKIAALF